MDNRERQLPPDTTIQSEEFAYTVQETPGQGGFGITHKSTRHIA
jgi:hypothetical protein